MKMGLKVNQDQIAVPSLSTMHLSSVQPKDMSSLLDSLREITTTENGVELIRDANDTFRLEEASAWSTFALKNSLNSALTGLTDGAADPEDRILDYSNVVKRIRVHEGEPPPSTETPYFNHDAYFKHLLQYQLQDKRIDAAFGATLLYGEVVTSTNTLLEK